MALRNQAEELRRRLSELEAALKEAQEQSRQKDDFIAMLGHELRNPLAAIQAGLELWASTSPERTAWIRQLVTRQTEQLARIVDDLLDMSRIVRGRIELRTQTLDLSEIVAGALASVNDLYSDRGHVLEVSVPDGIQLGADPVRLEQILVNLLTNAARYTDEGGHISLSAEQEGHEIRIQVQDNGVGLSPEALTSIFKTAAPVGEASKQGRGGLGIGLRLTRELVEMHRGTISAASEGIGKGSRFTVILPVGAIEEESTDSFDSPGMSRTPHPRRVLVVDDNADLAVSLSFLLTESGHTVESAFNGTDALNLARVFLPEVTLLDVGLPDLDGYLVAERLRCLETESGCRTTIIGVSGFAAERHENQTQRRLLDYYLVKPFSVRLLYSLVEASPHRPAPLSEDRHFRSPESQSRPCAANKHPLRRILIIDDSRTVADLTQELLEAEGYQTAVAYEGRRGIDRVSEFRPDVVLCDLNLTGDLSGWEVASAIKEGVKPVPVLVALTAWGGDEIRQAFKKSAFDFHLSKPLDVRKMERLIATTQTA